MLDSTIYPWIGAAMATVLAHICFRLICPGRAVRIQGLSREEAVPPLPLTPTPNQQQPSDSRSSRARSAPQTPPPPCARTCCLVMLQPS